MSEKLIEKTMTELVQRVTDLQGCKGVDLAAEGFSPKMLQEAVDQGLLGEVEYRLPLMDWRVKSFYFPLNTKVVLNNLRQLDSIFD